ncbi:hypothetical protein G6F42_026428 [Rhizopus arrhizus]|nr:hypothetical protein G6F42_026428 [Rhizopus arrhizus]
MFTTRECLIVVARSIAPRDQKHQSNFVEFRNYKIVYRRYAGLFFCVCVDANDNELSYLEAIHFFVEVLDAFFGNVCELDLVFNFYKVYAILDEVFLAGEIEETNCDGGGGGGGAGGAGGGLPWAYGSYESNTIIGALGGSQSRV